MAHSSIWLSSLWGEGRTWQWEWAVLMPSGDLRQALGPCSLPNPNSPPPPFQPQGAGTQGGESNLPGGNLVGGSPLQGVQRRFFLVSFPISGRGEAAGAGKHCAQVPAHLPPACPWVPSSRGTRAQAWSVERFCFPKNVGGAGAGTPPPPSGTHLGLVSMLMYLRSSAAYWANCSGVALSPGYTGSSGVPEAHSDDCSNKATHVDRSSRERQWRAAAI